MKTRLDFRWGKESVWLRLRLAGLVLLLLMLFPAMAQAQLASPQYTTSPDGSGGVLIAGFSATGSGPLAIPAAIGGQTVTGLGQYAFYGVTNITGVTIPNTVTSIALGAFLGCTSLTGVAIPNSVTSIGDDAFSQCTSLTSVTIPNGVKSIGSDAFLYCSSLTSVTIPNSVTSIGLFAFYSCTSLGNVTVPSSVTSIGDYAFGSCSGLTSAVFTGGAPTMGFGVFSSVASGFAVSYYSGAAGFTSPNWTDSSGDLYPSVAMTKSLNFSQWAAKYSLSGPMTDTPEHDGVSNLLKYLLDINPSQPMSEPDKAALPKVGVATLAGAKYLTLTYRQSTSVSGLVVTVQVSTNLQSWSAPSSFQTVQVGTDAATGDPMMQVQVPASGPMMFIRLSLTGS